MWQRIIWLFIFFLLGKHICFPNSPRYLELADSADFFIAHENWDRAEKAIVEALRLEPANFHNSLLLSNLGLIRANKGEYDKAIEALSLGLNISPSSAVILNNRAHTYLMMDSVAKAVEDLDRSLAIDSLQEWTLQTRAFIALQDRETERATRLFHRLKEAFPRNTGALSGLAAIAELDGKSAEAISLYKEVLAINNDDNEAREAYIYLLIETEDYSEARLRLREAIEAFPQNPMFYLLRGYLHRLNYRPEEALADKKLAIAKGLDPSYAASFIP